MSISKTKESRDGSTVIFAEKDKEQLPRTIRFFLPKPKGLHYIFKYIKPNKFNIQGNPFECCLWVSGNSGNPSGSVVKKPPAYAEDAGDRGSIPDLEDMRKQQPTPVFLPGKSHRQRSLMDCGSWGHQESNTTEHTCTHIRD